MNASSKDKAKAKKKRKPVHVELHVAPQVDRVCREVVADFGSSEPFIDVLDTNRASAREKFIGRLASRMQVDEYDLSYIDDLLVKKAMAADEQAEQAAEKASKETPKEDKSAKILMDTSEEVIAAAKKFLKNPKMMDELANNFEQLGIAGETQLAQTEYMVGTSRLLSKPLHATIKASSSSGKSYVSETIVSLFPQEAVLIATDITENALFYVEPDALKHMLIFMGERKHGSGPDDAANANATRALRELMSSGRLKKLVPMKTEGGKIRTEEITVNGPIAFLGTTTEQEIFEEDSTRQLSLATDETSEQTAAILNLQAKQAAWKAATPEEQNAIREKHHAAQRLLKKLRVCIPFAEQLLLPATSLIARRAFPHLLGFIAAVALLRQHQKTIHEDGHINATIKDYKVAYGLMVPILRRTFSRLSDRALKLLGAIRANTKSNQEFDRVDCATWAGVGLTEISNRLRKLVEAGMVEQVSGGGKGLRYTYKVVNIKHAKCPPLQGLITPAELRKALKKGKNKTAIKAEPIDSEPPDEETDDYAEDPGWQPD